MEELEVVGAVEVFHTTPLEVIFVPDSVSPPEDAVVLVIEDADLRAKLQAACWGQTQIVDASHLFIFASLKDIGEK